MVNAILQWLYPPICMICNDVLATGIKGYGLCEDCENKLVFIEGQVCPSCGLSEKSGGKCIDCAGKTFYFDQNIALFSYEEVIRNIIHQFKYNRKASYGRELGKLLYGYLFVNHPDILKETDLIIPVPIHKKRLKKRGFNQAMLLAGALSKSSEIPVCESVIRCRHTQAQSLLKAPDKARNVENAFRIKEGYGVQEKSILLVDDIFTTGSTLNEVSRILKENGAKNVTGITLAVIDKNV